LPVFHPPKVRCESEGGRKEQRPMPLASQCRCIPSTCRMRQHTSAYVSIRQHTSAYVSIHRRASVVAYLQPAAYVSIRQHTSAYVSIHRRASVVAYLQPAAYVSKYQHTLAYVSTRQHTSASQCRCISATCNPPAATRGHIQKKEKKEEKQFANARVNRQELLRLATVCSEPAYVSISQHTSASATCRIRQHTSA
jgi:hypothetical protein